MTCRRVGRLLLLLGCLGAATTRAPAQPAPQPSSTSPIVQARDQAQSFLDRMVRITARPSPAGPIVTGYGFVVGEHATARGEPGYLVVTADHLVRAAGNPAAGLPPPRVNFYADLTRNAAAELLEARLPPQQGDLAVLVVPRPPIPPLRPAMMGTAQALAPGMPTWQLGLPGVWASGSANARFALREPTGWLNFDGLDASPGSAGGAVVTELGLVGMVVGPGAGPNSPVRVLPIELMAAKFAEWRLPWNIPTSAGLAPSAGGTNLTTSATPAKRPEPPRQPPANSLAPITIVTLLPSELASRGSWVPPGARVSPWSGSGVPLMAAPLRNANRVGALPAGNLLPQDLWSHGAYDIQSRIDDGAWFLLGTAGQPLGYVAGTDVVEVWPPEKPGTPPEGKIVRQLDVTGGKAVLRDAGSHYELTIPLTCALAYCDSILIYTPVPPSPGAITPTFQVPQIIGSWHENDTTEVTLPLPRALVETKGTQLITCVGMENSCRTQRIPIGG